MCRTVVGSEVLGTPSMRESDSPCIQEGRTARDGRLTELTLFGVLPGTRTIKLTSASGYLIAILAHCT